MDLNCQNMLLVLYAVTVPEIEMQVYWSDICSIMWYKFYLQNKCI